MAKFRLSDLWWDDRSIGGRIALYFARQKNGRLSGRRSYSRKPVTYDDIVVAYSAWLWWVLKTLGKVALGLFAFVVFAAVGLLIYSAA